MNQRELIIAEIPSIRSSVMVVYQMLVITPNGIILIEQVLVMDASY